VSGDAVKPLTKVEREEFLRFDRNLSESDYRNKIARWEATVIRLEALVAAWETAAYDTRVYADCVPPSFTKAIALSDYRDPLAQTSIACINAAHDQCNGKCISWRATKRQDLRDPVTITTGDSRLCKCSCHCGVADAQQVSKIICGECRKPTATKLLYPLAGYRDPQPICDSCFNSSPNYYRRRYTVWPVAHHGWSWLEKWIVKEDS